MTPATLCAVIVIAAESFAPLSEAKVELACSHAGALIEEADRYGFDPAMLFAQIWVESRWMPEAVSWAGACGLTQVLPKYVDETCDELKDPRTSIRVGTRSLNKWTTKRVRRDGKLVRVKRSGGIREALACYNAGNACLKSKRGTSYANLVLRIARSTNRELKKREGRQGYSSVEPQTYPVSENFAYLPLYMVDDRPAYYPVLVLETLSTDSTGL